jgi:TetR/AcrR family tetracycline transcriptional repressor
MLNREVVLRAALEVLDDDGLSGLSLRAVAGRLAVTAMALYKHYENKAALLDALAAYALQPLEETDDLESAMRGLHARLSAHPGLIDLFTMRPDPPRIDRIRDRKIRALVGAGVPRAEAADALRALTGYVLGYVLLTRTRHAGRERAGSFDYGLRPLLQPIEERITA